MKIIKKGIIILLVVVLSGFSCFYCWDKSATVTRYRLKKSLCLNDGKNCECYQHITDYRLSDREVVILLKYQQELNKNKKANVLEFASVSEIQKIAEILQVCQPQQVQTPAVQRPTE